MKITALEIRQKQFQKGFRGFDKEEVEAFLLSMSQEWERMVEQNKEYAIKLENAQKEVSKLREVEDSLFKTLKTAETTGANVVEHANKSANLIVQEARLKAEQTIDEAQRKADKVFTRMLNEFSELEREFRTMENVRDNLHAEIRNLCNDSLDKIERVDVARKDFTDVKSLASRLAVNSNADIEVKKASEPQPEDIPDGRLNEESEENLPSSDESKIKFEVPSVAKKEKSSGDSSTSFFDDITE